MIVSLLRWGRHQLARRRQRLWQLKSLGKPTLVHREAVFASHANIEIGSYCRIGAGCFLEGRGGITLSDGVILAPDVVMLSSSHDYDQDAFLPYGRDDSLKPILVGAGVWIGYRAMIMPGVELDVGSLVAAGSVVTKSVGPGEIVAGNPASKIGTRNIDPEGLHKLAEGEHFYLKDAFETDVGRVGNFDRSNEV